MDTTSTNVTRPDKSVPVAEITKPASPSTEASRADGGVGQTNDLSKADIEKDGGSAGSSNDPKGALGALTSSRGPLSSDTASQINQTQMDRATGDFRSDSQKYADQNAEATPAVDVVPPRPDGKMPAVNLTKPFGAVATQVTDAQGRIVCYVGQDHLPMAHRENIAQLIASALNTVL